MAYLFSTTLDVFDETLDAFLACIKFRRPEDLAPTDREAEPMPGGEPETTAEPAKAKPVKAKAAKTAESVDEVPVPTIEELRALAGKLVDADRQDVLGDFLEEFDAGKLSGIPSAKRVEARARLQELVKEYADG